MSPVTTISVTELIGLDTLAGKVGALRDFPKFLSAIEATPEASTVVLDWSGIELATASYFAATVVSLIRMSKLGELDRYFVLVGLNQTSLDELKLAIDVHDVMVLLGKLDRNGSPVDLRVFGKLETPYAETLEAVMSAQSASAGTLHDEQHRGKTRIGKTGWANRLSYLHSLRLLKKRKVGRELVFEALTGGESHGR